MAVTINGTTGITTPDLTSTADISANSIPFGAGGGNVATNVAAGDGALNSNTTASGNTALGYQTGYTNQTGNYNTFVGYKAGYTSNVSGNAFNTTVGTQAGNSLTTGTNNTFLGCGPSGLGSGFYITTGSKNSILGGYNGNQGGLDIRTASNYIVLSDGDGNPRAYHNATDWNITSSRLISQKGMGPNNAVSLTNGSSTTVTVPAGCVIWITPDGGSVQTSALFACKSTGGSQGCYVFSQTSAGWWGFGTTSEPGSGNGRVWVSGSNTMSISNRSGSSFTFYVTFMATSE